MVNNENGSVPIHKAAVELGETLAATKPEIIFLATPHGVAATNDFLVYTNSRAEGFSILGSDLNDPDSEKLYRVDLNMTMNANVSSGIVEEAQRRGLNVTGLLSFADDESYPQQLGWGEVIPMSFLNATLNDSRVVVLSAPTRRYDGMTSHRNTSARLPLHMTMKNETSANPPPPPPFLNIFQALFQSTS